MVKEIEKVDTEDILNNVLEGIRKVKGKEIVNIDLSGLENRICHHFVICHGDSGTHVNAIAESVEMEMKKSLNLHAWHKEGYDNAQWVLVDFGSVVVHVFQKEFRDFYRLEELWADGKIARID